MGSLVATPANLVAKQWAKDTFVEGFPQNFFYSMMGESDAIIHVKKELENDAGNEIKFGLVMGLDESAGITGDSVLIGNEAALSIYDDVVKIDQLRNGVRLTGRMDEKKARFDLRGKAKNALKEWLPRAIDYHTFRQLCGDTSYTFAGNTGVAGDVDHCCICGNTAWNTDLATTEAAMDVYDILTTYEVDKCVEMAKALKPMIRPVRIDGQEYYVMLIHPYVGRNLKYGTDSKWYEAMRDAAEKGKSNPLFTGALGIYNGVVIKEHRFVMQSRVVSGATGVYRNLFLGAQAGVVAFAEKKLWGEDTSSDEADYGNRPGFMAGFIGGFKKTRFNVKDFGLITVPSYAGPAPQEDHQT